MPYNQLICKLITWKFERNYSKRTPQMYKYYTRGAITSIGNTVQNLRCPEAIIFVYFAPARQSRLCSFRAGYGVAWLLESASYLRRSASLLNIIRETPPSLLRFASHGLWLRHCAQVSFADGEGRGKYFYTKRGCRFR